MAAGHRRARDHREVEAEVGLGVDVLPLVDVRALVGEGRHHLGVAEREEGLGPEEGPGRARRERHELLRVPLPQVAVDLEVVLEEAPAVLEPRRLRPDLRDHLREEGVVENDRVAGRRLREEAVHEGDLGRVAGVVLGHHAQPRVVGEVPRHPEEREPVLLPPARQRRAGEEPGAGAHAVARRRSFRPGRGRRPTRPGPRSAGRTAAESAGGTRRTGSRSSLTTGAGWRSHVGARSATTRTTASPSFRSGRAERPTSTRSSSLSARAPDNAQGGSGRWAFCATTRATPACSTSTRRPARPRPGADATTTRPSASRWPSRRCGSRRAGRGRRAASPRDRRRRGARRGAGGRSSGSSSFGSPVGEPGRRDARRRLETSPPALKYPGAGRGRLRASSRACSRRPGGLTLAPALSCTGSRDYG